MHPFAQGSLEASNFVPGTARPFYQSGSGRLSRPALSTRSPMAVYQARSNRMAPDFATNCIFAIVPHDQFISGRAKLFLAKAGPMAVLSARGQMAVLSRQKQPECHFRISLSAAGTSYSQQKQAQWPFINARPNGRFIKAEATGMPDLQIIFPHDQFISGRDKLFSAKAGPMAVLSRQKQPDGQTSRFRDKLHFRYYLARSIYQRPGQALLSKSRPDGRFINARPQWPFYQGRSNRNARPPDFSDKLHFRYYPARSVYQRPGQAILSKSRPNGRFIKAEATGWRDLQISTTNCIFAIIPHNQFNSGRAKLFSAKAGPMAVFINARPSGRFIKAEATPPDFSDKLHFRYYPARSIYQRPVFSAKAGPMAVLSTRGPMAVLSRAATG